MSFQAIVALIFMGILFARLVIITRELFSLITRRGKLKKRLEQNRRRIEYELQVFKTCTISELDRVRRAVNRDPNLTPFSKAQVLFHIGNKSMFFLRSPSRPGSGEEKTTQKPSKESKSEELKRWLEARG